MDFNPYAKNKILVRSVDKNEQMHTYDISTLVTGLQYSTVLEGQPGKLTFQLQKDPNGILNIHNGSSISFTRNNKGIFFGYVFDMGTDANETYQITAYDQLRYFQNEETEFFGTKNVQEVFSYLCNKHLIKNYKIIEPCTFVCPKKLYEGQSLFAIMKNQFDNAFINDKSKYYFLKDNFGILEFTSLQQNKTNLVIGEKSLLTSYNFEISIDKDTFNNIKLVKVYNSEDKKGKKTDTKIIVPYTAKDNGTQQRWGFLQKVVNVDENMNQAQIIELGNKLLEWHNQEKKTFKLSALGVDGINAGSGISVNIPRLNTKKKDENGSETNEYLDMWVVGATHTYQKNMHTMELTVQTF